MDLYITFAVLIGVVIAFIAGKWPFGLTAMLAATVLQLTGVLTFEEAFGNLANNNVVMVGAMFVLSAAIGKTSIVDNIRDTIMKRAEGNPKKILFAFMLVTFILAQFIPPTAIITMLLPFAFIIDKEGGVPRTKSLYSISVTSFMWQGILPMTMGISLIAMLNGYLEAAGTDLTVGVLDRVTIGFVPALVGVIFMMTIGYKLLPDKPSREINDEEFVNEENNGTNNITKRTEKFIYIIFSLVIVLMIFASQFNIDTAVIPVAGVIALVIFGCMNQKEVIGSLNMNILFMLAGVMSLSAALGKTGAGELIADGIIYILGGNPSPIFIMAVFYFVPNIMSQLLSNTATWVLVVPIAITTALSMGYDPRGIAMLAMLGANADALTPMGSPSMAISFGAGGYKFGDLIKTGVPLLIVYGIACILMALLVYPPM